MECNPMIKFHFMNKQSGCLAVCSLLCIHYRHTALVKYACNLQTKYKF